MKPMESLVSLATAVVVTGDGMKSRWCTLTARGAAHAHIARFAAAYPCLNRGADFRFLANNRRANPRSLNGICHSRREGWNRAAGAGEEAARSLDPTRAKPAEPANRACGRSCSP